MSLAHPGVLGRPHRSVLALGNLTHMKFNIKEGLGVVVAVFWGVTMTLLVGLFAYIIALTALKTPVPTS